MPTSPIPTPLYAPEDVPRIKAAKRLANVRRKQLLRAAARAHDDPPPPPGLGVCCGSSCDPCVNDLWREEVAVWRERWGVTDQTGDGDRDGDRDGDTGRKMPGSLEW
ncbi:uncharacterized protein ACLA_048700 [Aspergillus clavatus NRRL 1]|uniref:Oxidoreductase-like domain-containing protein n=1 Tax=Aspergillus clavatus (strain ATCC 1007 / CBS 513.65 / DSM 816 / NCTC 3887 / NRRL 1 / QM 1276 / 107) TaxID=344612 RepID=A1CHP3_ASPCL|nr:uncharacterized protein ACLA_048700 [Aspergillus clavatus NRRL 1]EAW10398.1 conserved hypothetical protein [Aspergillus clavatus NRRL 1]